MILPASGNAPSYCKFHPFAATAAETSATVAAFAFCRFGCAWLGRSCGEASVLCASACVHPCPENAPSKVFYPIPGVNRRLHPSLTLFGRGSAISAVYASACRRPSIHPCRSGSRLVFSQIQQTAKRSSHRTRSVGQRSLPKNVPSCVFQLSGLWPGRLRRLSR